MQVIIFFFMMQDLFELFFFWSLDCYLQIYKLSYSNIYYGPTSVTKIAQGEQEEKKTK